MKQSVRMKALSFVNWLTGLCALACVIVSFRGLYGMLQVWTGELTYVPLIGELIHPLEAESGIWLLLSFFEVAFGGLAYAFMWLTPAGIVLIALTLVSDKLTSARAVQLEPIQ